MRASERRLRLLCSIRFLVWVAAAAWKGEAIARLLTRCRALRNKTPKRERRPLRLEEWVDFSLIGRCKWLVEVVEKVEYDGDAFEQLRRGSVRLPFFFGEYSKW